MKTWIPFIPIAILIPSRITEPEKQLKISQLSSHLSKIKLKEYGGFFCMFTGNPDNMYKEWNYEWRQAIAFFRLPDPSLGYESMSWSDERWVPNWAVEMGRDIPPKVKCCFSLTTVNSSSNWRRVSRIEMRCLISRIWTGKTKAVGWRWYKILNFCLTFIGKIKCILCHWITSFSRSLQNFLLNNRKMNSWMKYFQYAKRGNTDIFKTVLLRI